MNAPLKFILYCLLNTGRCQTEFPPCVLSSALYFTTEKMAVQMVLSQGERLPRRKNQLLMK